MLTSERIKEIAEEGARELLPTEDGSGHVVTFRLPPEELEKSEEHFRQVFIDPTIRALRVSIGSDHVMRTDVGVWIDPRWPGGLMVTFVVAVAEES